MTQYRFRSVVMTVISLVAIAMLVYKAFTSSYKSETAFGTWTADDNATQALSASSSTGFPEYRIRIPRTYQRDVVDFGPDHWSRPSEYDYFEFTWVGPETVIANYTVKPWIDVVVILGVPPQIEVDGFMNGWRPRYGRGVHKGLTLQANPPAKEVGGLEFQCRRSTLDYGKPRGVVKEVIYGGRDGDKILLIYGQGYEDKDGSYAALELAVATALSFRKSAEPNSPNQAQRMSSDDLQNAYTIQVH